MANTGAMCTSFKQDILNGLHAFGTTVVRAGTTKDSFKLALYLASASLGAGTTAYSATGEISSSGYTAGGAAITNANAPSTSGTAAIWTPSGNPGWVGITAGPFDAALLYNDTATGKNAVGVFTFGAQTITAGTFTLTMPSNAVGTALLQIS